MARSMGATRKDKKKQAQRIAVTNGTAIEKDASGKPKKAPPPSCVCELCKKPFNNVVKDSVQLKLHAESKHAKQKYEEYFPENPQ